LRPKHGRLRSRLGVFAFLGKGAALDRAGRQQ
jgi:hypothetical protein